MTEREFYISCIPMIAEMIVICQESDERDYEDWKRETMEHVTDSAKSFMEKVFVTMDKVVLEI